MIRRAEARYPKTLLYIWAVSYLAVFVHVA